MSASKKETAAFEFLRKIQKDQNWTNLGAFLRSHNEDEPKHLDRTQRFQAAVELISEGIEEAVIASKQMHEFRLDRSTPDQMQTEHREQAERRILLNLIRDMASKLEDLD